MMQEFWMPSHGGGQLRCGLWTPEGQPRLVLQLVHGIAEHIERYDDFACYLVQRGIAVVADDHMGHGKSVGEGQLMGYFTGGWLNAVADERRLQRQTMEQFPGIPYVMMGHSMGSFLTRSFLWKYPDSGIRGVILSGTGWQSSAVLIAGRMICRREEKKHTDQVHSDLLQSLMFGAYNQKFAPARTEHDWICTDEAVVDAYCNDPMCGFKPKIGLVRDMLKGISMNQKPENLAFMKKSIPVWFFSGAQDPVGDMGKGVRKTAQAFRKAGMERVDCTLYPGGRHEMLNETNRLQVFDDVVQWLEREVLQK